MFLQAEDGIRYWSVTGVQTCALPIYALHRPHLPAVGAAGQVDAGADRLPVHQHGAGTAHADAAALLRPVQAQLADQVQEQRVGRDLGLHRLAVERQGELHPATARPAWTFSAVTGRSRTRT